MEKWQAHRDFLRKVMRHPEVYVGAPRLDYVHQFLCGHFLACPVDWDEDQELQQWLFTSYSASIRTASSVNGGCLLFTCFGKEGAGMRAYRAFIEEAPFAGQGAYRGTRAVSSRVYTIYSRYKWKRAGHESCAEDRIDFPPQVLPFSPQGLVALARAVTGRPRGELAVYLRLRPWFMLVRVLYRARDGWVDATEKGSACIPQEHLVLLHAYAELLFGDMPNGDLATWHGTVAIRATDGDTVVTTTADTRTRKELDAAFGHMFDISEYEAMVPQFLRWKQGFL